MKVLYKFVQLVALGVLGACTTTAPFDYPQTPSTAFEDTDDGLSRQVRLVATPTALS